MRTIKEDLIHYRETGEYEQFYISSQRIIHCVLKRYKIQSDIVEDLHSEIQVKLFICLDRIKPDSNPYNFVYTLAKNHILDSFKKVRSKRQLIIVDYPIELVPDSEQIILKKMEVIQDLKKNRRIIE
jgi:DNA-directed RNA polymerase specialized sigma24 family protein